MSSDEQREAGVQESLDRIFENWQNKLHTGCPAVVESYDADARRVDVRIPFREVYKVDDGTLREHGWPVIPDVPVKFLRTGGYVLTCAIDPGDLVWLTWSMYPTGEWQASEGAEDIYQQINGRHLAGDVFCDPNSAFLEKNNPGVVKEKSWFLQHIDGKVSLELEPGGKVNLVCDRLNIGSESAGTALARADKTKANDDTNKNKINEILTVSAASGGFIPPGSVLPIATMEDTASGKAYTND